MRLVGVTRFVMLAALVGATRASLRPAFVGASRVPSHLRSSRPAQLRQSASPARFAPRLPSGIAGPRGLAMQVEGAEKPFVVTTPLYYANGPPHMGSAYPTIATDIISQYRRMQGESVVFITGSDEHGEKIATTAEGAGKAPLEFCDNTVKQFESLWSQLGIRYDSFIRTTDPKHEAVVTEFFNRVNAKGDIYKKDYEGHYCVGCEAYLGDDEMETLDGVENVCSIHRKPAELRREENYFFRLSKYQGALEKLFEENPEFVQPSYRFNEVKKWVEAGVPDFSISRSTISWGIPVPNDPNQVIYVWFDALLGYISGLLHADDVPTLDNAMARGWPADVHIIGKDILRFHAVYWPAMLLSAGLPLPKKIYSHGFLTKDGLKMGKSLGNVLEPTELVNQHGSDAVRYYFSKGLDFGGDGDFSQQRFTDVLNADLANDVGNLLNRCLKPLRKHAGDSFPAHSIAADHRLRLVAADSTTRCAAAYEALDFRAAGEAALDLSRAGNKYMDDMAPWTLFKNGKIEEGCQVLMEILAAVRVVSVLLAPILPTMSREVYNQLGLAADFDTLKWSDAAFGELPIGVPLPEPRPIFERILTDEERAPPPPKPQKKKGEVVPEVDDILRLDLRVGEILKAEMHPDAESLYVETIACGDAEPRQVVSGLAKYMSLESLQGKKVVVLCNLKPAKMRGVESFAMVLAAGTDSVELLEPPADAAVGSRVTVEGMGEPQPDEILKSKSQQKVWDRVVEKLATNAECVGTFDGKMLQVDGEACRVPSLQDSPIK